MSKSRGYWREVPCGARVSRLYVINHLIESGYKAEDAPSFVDAIARGGGFVVVGKRGERTFYEFVE